MDHKTGFHHSLMATANIYAHSGRDEQLGWMSSAAPECAISHNDRYLQHITSSLPEAAELPEEHVKWLYHWSGAYECVRTFNESQLGNKNHLFGARVLFLKNNWHEPAFRPFETIESAIDYLRSQEAVKLTARLSTTRPGFITITTSSPTESFSHTRFQVLQNAAIVDRLGGQHRSLSSLARTCT
jgi:hypothetical protein